MRADETRPAGYENSLRHQCDTSAANTKNALVSHDRHSYLRTPLRESFEVKGLCRWEGTYLWGKYVNRTAAYSRLQFVTTVRILLRQNYLWSAYGLIHARLR